MECLFVKNRLKDLQPVKTCKLQTELCHTEVCLESAPQHVMILKEIKELKRWGGEAGSSKKRLRNSRWSLFVILLSHSTSPNKP